MAQQYQDPAQQYQAPPQQQPVGHPQAPHAGAGYMPEKQEMQQDVNQWINRANTAAKEGLKADVGDAPWSSGFWDCCSPADACFLSCCCPCIQFGKTHHRLNKDPDLKGYSMFNGSCCVWYLAACFGLHCIPNLLSRQDIRNRSNPRLGGSSVGDFFKAWCCNCCDLMQQEKEAQHLLAKERQVVQHAPVAQQQMSYPPPAH